MSSYVAKKAVESATAPLLENKFEPNKIEQEIESKYGDNIGKPEREFHSDSKFLNFLAKFTKCLIPFFMFCIIMTIAGFVLGVIGTLDYLIGALIILAINFCGGIVGAIGVFRWGTVSEQIKWMKEENQKYATEIDEMKQNTKELRNTVAGINEHVLELNQGADSLKEQIEQFDELKESLTQINADNEVHIFYIQKRLEYIVMNILLYIYIYDWLLLSRKYLK